MDHDIIDRDEVEGFKLFQDHRTETQVAELHAELPLHPRVHGLHALIVLALLGCEFLKEGIEACDFALQGFGLLSQVVDAMPAADGLGLQMEYDVVEFLKLLVRLLKGVDVMVQMIQHRRDARANGVLGTAFFSGDVGDAFALQHAFEQRPFGDGNLRVVGVSEGE